LTCRRETAIAASTITRKTNASGLKPSVSALHPTASQTRPD
jgi:hypothetical protein